jgi:hypothetical protein
LIFFNLSISINLSFFFYWILNSYQSRFFSSSCFSLIVAAFAYATILFISFTSSSSSWEASTARVWTEFLNYCFSFSISEGGKFFFFSSSNLNICSFFAFARASLCYFYYSAIFFSSASSYFVGFLIVSYMIILLPWFSVCPIAWVLRVIYDYNSFISPFGSPSLIILHFFEGNWF